MKIRIELIDNGDKIEIFETNDSVKAEEAFEQILSRKDEYEMFVESL